MLHTPLCISAWPFTHAVPLYHLLLKVDCAQGCARQDKKEKRRLLPFIIFFSHITSTALHSESLVDFLFSFLHLRFASLSGHQRGLTCRSSVQDHLQTSHPPSGKMHGLGRTWTGTTTGLSTPARR